MGVQAYFENEGREKNERSNIHLIGRLDKEHHGNFRNSKKQCDSGAYD